MRHQKDSRKIIKGIEKMDRKENILTLVMLKFSLKNCQELKDRNIVAVRKSSRFLSFRWEVWKNWKSKNVNIWILEEPIEKLETSTCGQFQIYFYNLFFRDEKNNYSCNKFLTKEAARNLFNEKLSLDQKENEEIINEYMRGKNKNDITNKGQDSWWLPCSDQQS